MPTMNEVCQQINGHPGLQIGHHEVILNFVAAASKESNLQVLGPKTMSIGLGYQWNESTEQCFASRTTRSVVHRARVMILPQRQK